jgi:GT2 family glycosyltransferase
MARVNSDVGQKSPQDIRLKARAVNQFGSFLGHPVDIIIPYHNQYDRVSRLLKSIWHGTRSNDYQITLVDDGSGNTDFTDQLEKAKIPRLNFVRIQERQGFGTALQEGFKNTKNPYVVFLHSDCVVEDINWLLAMGETYERLRTQGVKLVSARLNNPTGGDPCVRGSRSNKTKDIILTPKSAAEIIDKDMYVPLVATLCHRDLFSYVGGFIKNYPTGWYEDLEFACRMHAKGMKQAISGQSYVYHEGGVTFDAVFKQHPEVKQVVEENFHRATKDIQRLGIL